MQPTPGRNRIHRRLAFVAMFSLLLSLLASPTLPARAAPSELFFSEYVEGSSYNKALEIYNGTGAAVDLAAYSLELYSNGSNTPSQSTALNGTLAPNDVFVIAHSSAAAAILAVADATNNSVINFNGDDAIVLRKGLTVIDSIGQVGVDPGSQWGTGDTSTADNTLRRKATVQSGDPNSSDPFDPAAEWDGYAQDTFDGLGTHSTVPTPAGPPLLLLSETVVTPTGGEFIEIFNPNPTAVDLSDVYLTDATYAGGGTFYYKIVTGDGGGGGFSDFNARFPDGASIGPGEYQSIALNGSTNFEAEYGLTPTYELFEEDGAADAAPDMREATPGSINNQGGLSNDGEVVILYHWDGQSDLVTDLDYLVWGNKAEAVDKTGVTIDGPDADGDPSAYLDDTEIPSQAIVGSSHILGNSWQRLDLDEGQEIKIGGNGAEGHDETSEDLGNTWCEDSPTPNAESVCIIVEPSVLVINEIHADPDAVAGDANGDGIVNTTQDEFVELVNTGETDLDIGGWTLSDGYGVRHTFPAGTIIPDGCGIVVFGGGTPTGRFGNVLVQAASTGTLGLNNTGDSITVANGPTVVVSASYGSEGGDNQSLTRDPDITGGFVKHLTATGADGALFSPGTMVDGSQFEGCPTCGNPATLIHEIQGSGAASPLDGSTVTVEAVVVADFQAYGGLGGYFLQEEDADADSDPATSEGIFVYNYSFDVNVGDVVRVTGVIDEYYDLTELTNVSTTDICSTDVSVTPASIFLPVSSPGDLEPFEGMQVVLSQELTVSENYTLGRYGELVLSNGRLMNPTNVVSPGDLAIVMQAENDLNRIVLDDGSTVQNPDPIVYPSPRLSALNTLRSGYTVQGIEGVLSYGFDAYRVHPIATPTFVATNARTSAEPVGGTLQVASLNVLNYFSTIDTGPDVCGPDANLDCRGADSVYEFERQRDKIISALEAIDAEIVGLIEIENHPTDAAILDLVNGVNDALGPGTYAYVETGPIGTDAIKVALIYKPANVSLVGDFAVLDSSVDPTFIDTKNRPALAQTFQENATGAQFTVTVNHLKSKGSDCNDVGDPDIGDGQGNCNLTRTSAAQALVNWLATDPTGSKDPDFLIIGDLNAYAMEDPITALKDAGYTDLIRDNVGADAYSYVFGAQAGYLDHALANASLTGQVTDVTIWHINADEPIVLDYNTEYKSEDQINELYNDNAYRASDHDPVIVGLNLNAPPDCSAAVPSIAILWPINHKFAPVRVIGITDPEGDPFTVRMVSIYQDEPVDDTGDGRSAPDGRIYPTHVKVRAERDGGGNGRVYYVSFTAIDAFGWCSGTVEISVPHSKNTPAIGEGPLYDSTVY